MTKLRDLQQSKSKGHGLNGPVTMFGLYILLDLLFSMLGKSKIDSQENCGLMLILMVSW